MQKWEYCRLYNIDFLSFSYQGLQIFITSHLSDPGFLYMNGTTQVCVCFKPESLKDKNLSFFDKVQDSISLINKIFPTFIINIPDSIIEYFPNQEASRIIEGNDWYHNYEDIIATKFIAFLLNSGWELMDREGYWFKRPLRE